MQRRMLSLPASRQVVRACFQVQDGPVAGLALLGGRHLHREESLEAFSCPTLPHQPSALIHDSKPCHERGPTTVR
jgi:hypothetical protein